MTTTVVMFQNYTLTAAQADAGRLISFERDWIGIGVRVDSVAAGSSCTFKVQWSNDNATWTDDPTPIAGVSAPGTYVGKRTVLGLYWRLAATSFAGTGVTCSAAAIY